MIKDILDKLPAKDHEQLMVAFENGWTQIIEYEPGKFIGVHVPDKEIWSTWTKKA